MRTMSAPAAIADCRAIHPECRPITSTTKRAAKGGRGVLQLVEGIQGRVDGGIHADGDRGAADVVVDARRHAHDLEASAMQCQRP